MTKSLVVLCDGTSNSIGTDLSNVAKLFRCLTKNDTQRVFYNPGVGTIGADGWWSSRLRGAKAIFEQAVGLGMDRDICDLYRFLCETYEPGDQIYLFGFSRGAYTVRIVAALIHMTGLLYPDQVNLTGHILRAYKRIGESDDSASTEDFERVQSFADVAGSRRATVHFLGIWDTVSSVIVPGRNLFGLLPGSSRMPFTRRNPKVRAVRHAVAIDERRAMFRSNRWIEDQYFVPDPFHVPDPPIQQDVKQVWFAGVHADVGGGYGELESGLAKIPLGWMLREAKAHGLAVKDNRVKRFIMGEKAFPKDAYVAPDARGQAHKSLRRGWWLVEYLPKKAKFRETRKLSFLGLYLPCGEPRLMTHDNLPPMIYASVVERSKATGYDPDNLPAEFSVED